MTHTNEDEAMARLAPSPTGQHEGQIDGWKQLKLAAETFCTRVEAGEIRSKRSYNAFKDALTSIGFATPTAQEAVAMAVMRQWPDPLTSDMARALEQHRGSLLVEIMSMFDQMQRQLDYSRGGKLGPVDQPQPSASVVEAAYLAGFMASSEGYNGEYPGIEYEHDARWCFDRDAALRALKGDV